MYARDCWHVTANQSINKDEEEKPMSAGQKAKRALGAPMQKMEVLCVRLKRMKYLDIW